jgi:Ca2+-binding RTX toxin-like protein
MAIDAIFSPQAVSSLTGTSLSQPGAASPAQTVAPASGNVFVGSSGNDVLTGAGANDTFVFAFGNTGHEIINNFQPSSDTIEFDNVDFTTFQQLQALMQPSGSDVVINLSASESVTLHGVTMDTLHASNFAILNHGILA